MSDTSYEAEQARWDIPHDPLTSDPTENPFKLVVNPVLRSHLRRALLDLIDSHDQELATHVSEGVLALDSYKEYIELFARSLCETMGTKEGVAYLMQTCGFKIAPEDINLTPVPRWQVQRPT